MRVEEIIIEGDNHKIDTTEAFGVVGGVPDFLTDGSVHTVAVHGVPVGYYIPMAITLDMLRAEVARDNEEVD